MTRRGLLAGAAVAVLMASACTAVGTPPAAKTEPPARTALPAEKTTIIAGATAADLAVAMSKALFQHSPAVVLVAENDAADLGKAGDQAVQLGVPLLLTPAQGDGAGLRTELERLQPGTTVTVGSGASVWLGSKSPSPQNNPAALTEIMPAKPLSELLVLALDQAVSQAAALTAKAAGARVVTLSNPDPRLNVAQITGYPADRVLAIGDVFGPADRLRVRVDTAATGVLLPGGGQVVFPYRRIVALYGHPGDAKLGSLGEQGVDAAVARAKQVAEGYSSLVSEPVVPAFEVIATVASGGAGPDGDYSSESSLDHLRPWVDAARKAGLYVLLDLQPGLADFPSQAKRYAELLIQPHVGLALDPEWRLKPGQKHMQQIGSVTAAEINDTANWLAQLTRENHLPQKVLMLHQFRLDMITDRSTLDASHDELQIVIHADGFGNRGQKLDTWRTLKTSPPAGIWWGWKNFYDEDQPTFTPAETYALSPSPVFVSYQ